MSALWAILTAFALVIAWAWFVHEVQTRRAVRRRELVFEEIRRLEQGFRDIQRAFGVALLPAVQKAADAMREFGEKWKALDAEIARRDPGDGAYS